MGGVQIKMCCQCKTHTEFQRPCRKEELKYLIKDLSGSPLVKTVFPLQWDTGSDPGQGTKILHFSWYGKSNKQSCLNLETLNSKINK